MQIPMFYNFSGGRDYSYRRFYKDSSSLECRTVGFRRILAPLSANTFVFTMILQS